MAEYILAGDSAVIIREGNEISLEINRKIRYWLFRLDHKRLPGVLDLIPSYTELLVCYNPAVIDFRQLIAKLRELENDLESAELPEGKLIEVPVVYGEEFGPDLEEVAARCGLSSQEVIEIHQSVEYFVYMLGFLPGFCYLGGLDQRIAVKRKQTPRLKVPAGSVGIADRQTGIYSLESPGGWQLIGQTPLKLFDPHRKQQFLFQPGDRLKFVPVEREEFFRLKEEQTKDEKSQK